MGIVSAIVQNANTDPAVRTNAILAVGIMCSVPKDVLAKEFPRPVVDRLFDQLVNALRDRDDNVAVAACRALGTAKENLLNKHVNAISELLTGEKQPSYARTRAALGVLGDKSAKKYAGF